jgi:hypothetical protein
MKDSKTIEAKPFGLMSFGARAGKITSFIPIILSLLLIMACGSENAQEAQSPEPVKLTIDFATDSSFEASLEAMRADLDSSLHEDFAEALLYIALEDIDNFMLGLEAMGNPSKLKGYLSSKVTNLDAQEIIDLYEAKEQEKYVGDLRSDIAELKWKAGMSRTEIKVNQGIIDDYRADARQLEKVKISDTKFYYNEEGYRPKPTIELMVLNGTVHPISRIYLDCVLKTPGRSIPWVKETMNYKIPGGIEPGEELSWILTPSSAGDWDLAPIHRDDMVLEITAYKVDGINEEAIYTSYSTDEYKEKIKEESEKIADFEKRLKRLEAELAIYDSTGVDASEVIAKGMGN